MQTSVTDKFNRGLRDLRVSVTDRCNFRCPYCMPAEIFGERYQFLPRADLLTFEEIICVIEASVQLGVRKIRLTGGEPLVRSNIERLIEMISSVKGIDDIAMTTNAYLLDAAAHKLKKAGLHRITVSLDSLNDAVFQKMNGRGFSTAKVINGIEAAKEAGFEIIKINAVVQKGVNEHTLIELVEWCREQHIVPRFIEYMDVGTLNDWKLDEVFSAAEIIDLIDDKYPVEPVDPSYLGEVARRYRFKDGKGEFGVISSVSQPFCGDCTRARLSPEGQFVTCLFAESGKDLRELLRKGVNKKGLVEAITGVWNKRDDKYSENRSSMTIPKKKVEMYHIGG